MKFSASQLYRADGFPKSMKERVKKFNQNVAPVVERLIAKGVKYGIRVKRSKARGRFLVAEKGVPKNTEILIYPGVIMPNAAHKGTQMYCYSLGEIDGVEAVLDGLPALNAPDLRDNNAAFNNHTCTGANIFGVWKQVHQDKATEMWYIVYKTGKDGVPPGGELLSNYNQKESKTSRNNPKTLYWRRATTLLDEGCPVASLVCCKCNKGKCPRKVAYDNRYMSGQLSH